MTATITDEAFVLRKVNYGEKDQIVTLFGRETGKFSAMAKAARGSTKRFGGGLQPMRELKVDCTHADRDLVFLREIDIVEDYPGIEGDYDRITVGSYATELVREMTRERDPAPRVFGLLRSFYRQLADLDDGRLALEILLHHFELKLLEFTGSLPSLEVCFRCGKQAEQMERLWASRSGEGLLCATCRRPGEAVGVVEPDTLAVLLYYMDPEGSPPDVLGQLETRQQARRVLRSSFQQLIGRELKSRAMLDTVLDGS